MCSLLIILLYPFIGILLNLIQTVVYLLPEGYSIEFVLNGPLETFTNAIGLWRSGFCSGMVDILDSQIKLLFMALPVAAVFRTPIGQDA